MLFLVAGMHPIDHFCQPHDCKTDASVLWRDERHFTHHPYNRKSTQLDKIHRGRYRLLSSTQPSSIGSKYGVKLIVTWNTYLGLGKFHTSTHRTFNKTPTATQPVRMLELAVYRDVEFSMDAVNNLRHFF